MDFIQINSQELNTPMQMMTLESQEGNISTETQDNISEEENSQISDNENIQNDGKTVQKKIKKTKLKKIHPKTPETLKEILIKSIVESESIQEGNTIIKNLEDGLEKIQDFQKNNQKLERSILNNCINIGNIIIQMKNLGYNYKTILKEKFNYHKTYISFLRRIAKLAESYPVLRKMAISINFTKKNIGKIEELFRNEEIQ